MYMYCIKCHCDLSNRHDADTASLKYAKWLNQWKGGYGLGQTYPREQNCFFCYTKQASVGGRSNLCVASY